jgi:hypothetical protein
MWFPSCHLDKGFQEEVVVKLADSEAKVIVQQEGPYRN